MYQAVQGNPDRAGGALAALAAGNAVPRPKIVETPRGGVKFTQRLAVILGDAPPGASEGWSGSTPRRVGEPRLNAWGRELFGDPSLTFCRATYDDPVDPPNQTFQDVDLAALGLEPLDLIDLARRNAIDELTKRIAWFVRLDQGLDEVANLSIDFAPASVPRATSRVFQDVLDAARTAGEVIDSAGTLSRSSLVRPGSADDTSEDPQTDGELSARAASAFTLLTNAYDDLVLTRGNAVSSPTPANLDALRGSLWSATLFGIPSAVPVNVSGSDSESRDALLAQADKIKAELDARKMAATLPVPPATMLGSVRMAAIFGPTFRFLPAFHPSNGAALQTSFTAGASFGTMQPLRWMHRFGRVRRAVGQLRRLAMSAEAIRFGEARFELSAAQLPDDAAPTWIALRIAEEEPLFKSGALSLSMRRSLTIGNLSNGTTLIAGLLVDEWSELVPTATEQTAFAVHYDSPGAEAPQAVLLAVPPDRERSTWDPETLLAIVEETFDLAKIRSVDRDLLGPWAMLVPTIYCAGDVENNTVSNDLLSLVVHEDDVMSPE